MLFCVISKPDTATPPALEALPGEYKIPAFWKAAIASGVARSVAVVVAVAVGGFAVAVGLIFWLLCLLERGKAVNAVRQCLYSLSGAGIMTLVIGVLLDVLNGNEFFSFSSQAVLDYLNIFKDSLSLRVNAVGIAVATVGISALACITVFSGRGKRCESKEAEFRNIGENKNENINTENN